MRRYRSTRRFVTRVSASILHTVRPDAPLPIEGCRCDDCENARDDIHAGVVEQVMGDQETATSAPEAGK